MDTFSTTRMTHSGYFKALCGLMSFLFVFFTVVPNLEAAVQLRERQEALGQGDKGEDAIGQGEVARLWSNLPNQVRGKLLKEVLGGKSEDKSEGDSGGMRVLSDGEMAGIVGGKEEQVEEPSKGKTKVSESGSLLFKASEGGGQPPVVLGSSGSGPSILSPQDPGGGGPQAGGGSVIRNVLDGFNVDQFSGAATMKIPLEVPSGRKGIQPELNLIFRNEAQNSWVGAGWIFDLGNIIRLGANKGTPKYDANDRYFFVVNGSPLEIVMCSVGSSHYRAKIEGLYWRFENMNNGEYWLARDPSGTMYYFGQTSNSRTEGNGRKYKWHLSRVEDLFGNYMAVTYFKDTQTDYLEVYPSRIDYTYDKNNQNNSCYVQFNLESRSDSTAGPLYNASFGGNYGLKTRKRLANVQMFGPNNTLQRKYVFRYAESPNTKRSLLSSLVQFGNNGTDSLPSTKFNYYQVSDPGPGGYITQGHNVVAFNNGAYRPDAPVGDVNGDGRTDLTNYLVNAYDPVYIWKSNGEGFNPNTGELWLTTNNFPGYTLWGKNMGDWEGDCKNDLIYFLTSSMYDPNTHIWHIYFWSQEAKSSGAYFTFTTLLQYDTQDSPVGTPEGSRFITGDFNGDGKGDYIAVNKFYNVTNPRGKLRLSGNGIYSIYDPLALDIYNASGDGNKRTEAADFNGDGFQDLVVISAWNHAKVWYSNGSNGFNAGPDLWTANGRFSIGDFNGDGLADIHWGDGIANPHIYLSTGDGFLDTGSWGGSVPFGSEVIGEFNRDRLSDFSNYSGDRFYLHASKGYGYWNCDNFYFSSYCPISAGDVNGDGLTDFMHYHSSNNGSCTWRTTGSKIDLLAGIENGYGGRIGLTYKSSTQCLNTSMPIVFQVVDSVRLFDGITSNDGGVHRDTITYTYEAGVYDPFKREFLGFQFCHKINNTTNGIEETETRFYQDPNLLGKAYYVTNRQNANVLTTQMYYWSYQVNLLGSLSVYPCIDSVEKYTYPGGGQQPQKTKVKYSRRDYDLYYGNIRFVTEKDSRNNGYLYPDTLRYKISEFHPADQARWIVNRLEWTILTTDPSADPYWQNGILRGEWFHYSDDHTRLDSTWTFDIRYYDENNIRFPLSTWEPLSEHYTYDQFGNKAQVVNVNGNNTVFHYDATNTFLTCVVNSLGHKDSTEYYGVNNLSQDKGLYGQAKRRLDPNASLGNGLVMNYTYDVFGRPSKEWGPGNSESKPNRWKTYRSFGNPQMQSILDLTYLSGTSAVPRYWTETYFDGLGKQIQVHKLGNGFSETDEGRVTILYDDAGRPWKTSLPIFGTHDGGGYIVPSGLKWLEARYDGLGRVDTIVQPNNKIRRVFYQGFKETRYDEKGNWKEYYHDGFDRLIKVKESNAPGLVDSSMYTFNIADDLLRIKNGVGDTTRFYYDSFGRKDTSYDKDRGTWVFYRDSIGNIKKITDARGILTEFTYDALDRLTRKQNAAGTTNYTFDQGSYGLGQLYQVQDPSGTATFTYDSKGQITSEARQLTGLGGSYTIGRAYNAAGQVTSLTYPGGEQVPITYNAYGWGKSVGSYASGVTYNPAGMMTQISYGNGAIGSFGYDPDRLWQTSSQYTYTPQDAIFLNLTYTHDDVGNVTQIGNTTSNRTWTFLYDNLNRLYDENCGGSSSYHYTYEYDKVGNRTKFNGTTYTYFPNTNRVQSDGIRSFTYDYNGNMLTAGNSAYTFDADNHLTQANYNTGSVVGVANYTYNSVGLRVQKVVNETPIGGGDTDFLGLGVQNGDGLRTGEARVKAVSGRLVFELDRKALASGQAYYIALDTDRIPGSGNVFLPDAAHTGIEAGSAWEYCLYVYDGANYGLYDRALNQRTQADLSLAGVRVSESGGVLHVELPLEQVGNPQRLAILAMAPTSSNKGVEGPANGWNILSGAREIVVGSGGGGSIQTYYVVYYLYDEAGHVLCELDGSGTLTAKYYYLNDQLVAKKVGTSNSYYHNDHLGSPRAMTNDNGQVIWQSDYYAFGKPLGETGSNGYKFNGKPYESTSLYYYGARYYDPEIGRFISPDAILGDLTNPQSLNPYVYCENNPMSIVDKNGEWGPLRHWWKSFWRQIAKGLHEILKGNILGGVGRLLFSPLTATLAAAGDLMGFNDRPDPNTFPWWMKPFEWAWEDHYAEDKGIHTFLGKHGKLGTGTENWLEWVWGELFFWGPDPFADDAGDWRENELNATKNGATNSTHSPVSNWGQNGIPGPPPGSGNHNGPSVKIQDNNTGGISVFRPTMFGENSTYLSTVAQKDRKMITKRIHEVK